jgi:hypothetical protein
MIPIGERCEECGKIHLIKPLSELDTLPPPVRAKTYKTLHRIFDSGYYASLDMDSEVWEFYLPLSVFKLERIQEEEQKKESKEEQYLRTIYEDDEEDF